MSRCHTTTNGRHVIDHQHLEDCPHIGLCAGCLPCTNDQAGNPIDHCTRCTRHVKLGQQTCTRCIGKARENLTRLARVAGAAYHEALEQGERSEAANLAGPAAAYDTWLDEQITRAQAARATGRPTSWEATDFRHPDIVIGYWASLIRDEHDLPNIGLPPWGYVTIHLDAMAQTPDWPNLATDLATAVIHAELQLKVRDRQQRGAPCVMCGKANLVKQHYEKFDQDGHPVMDADGCVVADDSWECPRCGETWSDRDYRSHVAGEYLFSAAYLNTTDIEVVYRVKPSTVTSWATRGKVRKGPRDSSGRLTYSTDDVKTMRSPHAEADTGA